MVKTLPANAGDVRDVGSIPGSGRSPGGGHGNPLQESCLENALDRGVWQAAVPGVTKSQPQPQRLSTQAADSYLAFGGTQHSLGEGSGTPLQYSCLEKPMDGGAWWAAVHGVAKSRTRLSDFTFTFHFHALEKEMATQYSCLENPRVSRAWWAALYGVALSRTQLKRLSSSSSTP